MTNNKNNVVMMNGNKVDGGVEIFHNEQFGDVRIIENNGKVMFCGKDVAAALGYSNTRDALNRHCKGVVKHDIGVQTAIRADGSPALQQMKMVFITEGDLYRLITHSKLPSAEKFESWVFDEVLPSVHKHGAYITPEALENMISSPEFGIRLLTELKSEQEMRKQLEAEAAANKPKVLFAESVESSPISISVSSMAKILKQNGINMGEKRLFKWLRENGYLIKRRGRDYNKPTQMSMNNGWFEIKEYQRTTKQGETILTISPKVTGIGQIYFLNKFLKERLQNQGVMQ